MLEKEPILPTKSDHELVASAYKKDTEQKILEYRATSQEIEQWYFSYDPINEKINKDILDSLFEDSLGEKTKDSAEFLARRPLLLINAGAKLLSNLTKIQLFREQDILNNLGILNCNLDKISIGSDIETLDLAITVCHILSEGIDRIAMVYSSTNQMTSDYHKVLIEECSALVFNLYNKIIDRCQSAANEENYSPMNQAMTASMDLSSVFFAYAAEVDNDANKRRIYQKHAVSILVDTIHTYYIDNPDPRSVKDGKKGVLYEAMWQLDTSFLLINSDDELNNAYIAPSVNRMDRPLIDKPQLNRGVDMICMVPVGSNAMLWEHFVQLKSSENDERAYHESIMVLKASQFKELQRNYLQKKLSEYEKWIKSEDAQVEKKLLDKTLPEAKQYVKFLKNDFPKSIIGIVAHRLGLSEIEFRQIYPDKAKYLQEKF